ncbi:hypothetical protein YC2023_064285 [Brassica napus]
MSPLKGMEATYSKMKKIIKLYLQHLHSKNRAIGVRKKIIQRGKGGKRDASAKRDGDSLSGVWGNPIAL